MITNNFNKELRGISDALRDLGYLGCNRYDDETKIFIERHLGKNGWNSAVLRISFHYSELFIRAVMQSFT